MFNKNDLNLLNTYKGLEYLLQSGKPDFKEVVKQIKYEKELVKLQIKLINVQNWVVEHRQRVLIIIEGREFAGKGGAIDAFTEHLNPRSMRTVALSKPTEKEREQWYFKRYIEQIPELGEIVFFDRSWYNRALVEPVNDFCTKKEYSKFIKEVNHFERMLSEDGIIIIKIYLSISKNEQKRRIEDAKKNPLRRWELSPVDLQAVKRWATYSKYEKEMFKITNTKSNPWHIFDAEDTHMATLDALKRILQLLPLHTTL